MTTAIGQTEPTPLIRQQRRNMAGDASQGLGGRLAKASALSFLIYVGGAGLSGVAQLVIARLVGPSSYGIYSYVLAWTTLLAYGASLGFSTVLLRFVPAYGAAGQWSHARGVLVYAFSRTFLTATAIAVLGVLAVPYLAKPSEHELATSMRIGLVGIPLVTFYVLGAAAARALGGVASAVAPERLGRDGLTITLVLLVWAFQPTEINAETVMAAVFLSSACTAGILLLVFRKLCPPQLRAASSAYQRTDWWHLALPVMMMIALEILVNRGGVMLLGWTGDTRAAGIFALGLNLALFLVLPRMAVGNFFSPNVSRLHVQHNHAGLQALFARATLLSLAGTTLLAVPLLVLTDPLLGLFGGDFVLAAPIVKILVIGQLFAAAAGPQLNLMTMTGHERAAAVIMLLGAIISLAGCAIGLALYGILGVAIATAATNVAWNVANAIYIFHRLRMKPGLIISLFEVRQLCTALMSGHKKEK